jgi:cytochrome P450
MRITLQSLSTRNLSQSLTQVLYDLAIHPEYVEEMRQEALNAVAEHGWTKAAMTKMRKVDSFMKESLRLNPSGSCKYYLSRL